MIRKVSAWIGHQVSAKSRYGVHSPFMYEFVTQVLPHRGSEAGRSIESLRKQLIRSTSPVEVRDYGAGYGGKSRPVVQTTVGAVARSSARGRKEGELLIRMMQHYGKGNALELGTNLGVGTAYLCAGAGPQGRVRSLEGAPALSALAAVHLSGLGYEAGLETGPFEELLPGILGEPGYRPDFVLLDGNHRYEPTIAYLRAVLPVMAEEGIIVLDDINWSPGMRRAWDEICAMPEIQVTADLFFIGICFLRKNQAKEHFRLRFRP